MNQYMIVFQYLHEIRQPMRAFGCFAYSMGDANFQFDFWLARHHKREETYIVYMGPFDLVQFGKYHGDFWFPPAGNHD